MKNFDFKTKCRALFINTICLFYDYKIELDDNFLNLLYNFANELLIIDYKKYINYLDLIVYFKHDKGQLKGLETEKTVSDLFSILDKLHSLNDVSILYDEIGQENVDKITELSNLFIKYLDYLEEIPVYPVKQ